MISWRWLWGVAVDDRERLAGDAYASKPSHWQSGTKKKRSFGTNHFRDLCPTRGQRAFAWCQTATGQPFRDGMCLCCAGQTHLIAQRMRGHSHNCRPALHEVNQQRKSSHTDKRGLVCLLHRIVLHWPATDVNVGHVDKLCLAKPMATPRAVFCTYETCA
jgi:hypothetical protein